MINVLVKDTNEVVGFPDTTDINTIESTIKGDTYGEISTPKPNWYQDKIQPLLEASGMDIFQPKFLGAKVEPDATRAFMTSYAKDATFGAFENKNPEVMALNQESQQQHPIASFTGALAGQTQAILTTAGLAEAFGLGKASLAVADKAGKIAAGVVSGAGVGALYGALTKGVQEINNSIDQNTYPDLIKVGESALKDAGAFGLYGAAGAIASVPVATAAIAGTAYSISKMEGASEQDALLNAAVMGIFHSVNSAVQTPESLAQHQDVLDKVKADYLKSKNPVIANSIVDRTAVEHTMAMKDLLPADNIAKDAQGNPIQVGDLKNAPELPAQSDLHNEALKYGTADEFIDSLNLTKQSKPHNELLGISSEVGIENFGGKGVFQIPSEKYGIKTNEEAINSWEEKIKNGEKPVIIISSKGFPSVVDGANRLEAYRNLGFKKVPIVTEDAISSIYNEAHTTQGKQLINKQVEDIIGGENAKGTGTETVQGSQQEAPIGGAETGVHLRDNAQGGMEAKAGNEVNTNKQPPKYDYFSKQDHEDMKNLVDWESYQQSGGMNVSGGKQDGQERVVTYSTSGHSQAMQKIGPKESFRLLEKARNGEKLTDKQMANVQLLLKDFRANIKDNIDAANKEIDHATADLTESEAAAVNNAFAQEEKTAEYDLEGNVVSSNPSEVSPFDTSSTELSTGKEKPRGLSVSTEQSAIKEALTKGFGDLPSYKTRNMDDIASRVSDFINKDHDLAMRIVNGEAPEQDGLRAQELFTGLRVKAEAEGDVNTIRELALSEHATAMATELGQRVKALDSGSPEDAVSAIRDVQDTRIKATKDKLKKSYNAEKNNIVKEIDKEIKKASPKIKDWNSFIDSLEC